MTRLVIAMAIVVTVSTSLVLAAGALRQRFQSSVGLVTMVVAVRQNNVPAAGLTAEDFRVIDNGRLQDIEVSTAESLPIDITLLVDTSGSMDGTMDELRAQVRAVARLLRPDDRLRLLTFAGDVREVFGFRASDGPLPLDSFVAGGWTSLYDALSLALVHQPAPGRGHFIVVFSDALDSASTIDLAMLQQQTRRSEAVLHVFVVSPRPDVIAPRMPAASERPPLPPVNAIADLTGGDTSFMRAGDDIAGSFRQALGDFRRRYVIRYSTQGAAQPGWHEVRVSIWRSGRFEIRTRQGYVQ